ncbi:tetratricopeptide repeat protein [Nonomuraea zeae]|uniref:Tetratricopeptide repeat protein n=1 Tax=Nonomuraea zeae TaxID=1642303 RepID=A0A5S4GR28_9ACTN|nr:tetratricopeptide repeat protein [Nonomuraea zeae]TMR35363.1 tetratricopeptide repeat protein [Nonomuraea zeae]
MASEQLDAAMEHWKAGDHDTAAALFRQIAATGDPEASHLLAGLLFEQGDLDGAEAAHRSVIQSGDPVFGQRSAIAMGMMLVTAKEWPAAHRVLSIASSGADFEVAALAETALVLVHTQLGDEQGAQAALERARRCHSPAVAELAARLELPEFDQDPASARDLYEEAEDEDEYRALLTCGDPDVVALAAFQLYQLYADEEDYEQAREVCEHAIAVGHPDHLAMAHKLLGAVLVDLGEYAESAAAYRVAAEDPRPDIRLPSLIELAKVTAQLGDVEETKAIFRRVVASGQRDYVVQAQACLAQMHTEAGDAAEALAALRAVLEAGESEWASVCVTLLGMLLEQRPDASAEILALAEYAAGHADADAAFKAGLLLEHAARQQPLADPVEEQALQDTDDGLARLKAGDLDEARRLLRRAADSGAPTQSLRAMVTLAELEMGEGDREQADELLAYVAESDDLLQGFNAAFLLHLLRESGDEPHPVLGAMLDHQRLGREEGLLRYRAAMDHADPAVSAIGTAVFAQVLASIGYDLSDAAEMFAAAADSGDPLALSYTALICKDILAEEHEAVALLRRAWADGHPALAAWVAHGLGALIAERDPAGARAAYAVAAQSGNRGLRAEATGSLLVVLERQGDLLAVCRVHERRLGEDLPAADIARSAWLLGFYRARLGDLSGARAAFGLAEGEPEDMGRFARCLLDLDFAGAAAAFEAMEEEGDLFLSSKLATECAHVWQRAGEPAAADRALSLVVEAGDPRLRQEAGCYLGALRNDAGDKLGALRAWERAAEGGNERLAVMTQRDIGWARQELGLYAEAAVAYRLALGQEGLDERRAAGLTMRLAEVLVADGSAEEGGELLREAFGAADGRLRLARLLRDHGDLTAALATLRTPGAQDGTGTQDADEARLLGELLARTGDVAGARAAFERAVLAAPESASAVLVAAARLLGDAGDAEYARSACERIVALDDDEWCVAVARVRLGTASAKERGWVLADDGDRAGAVAALTEFAGSELMAELLLALNDDDAPAVRRLLAGADPEARREPLAETLDRARSLDDGEVAAALHQVVIDLGEPEIAAEAAVALGAILAEAGHHSRAELSFLPATEHAHTARMAWRNIAIVRHRRGDLDGAIEAARAAMPFTAVYLAELLAERGDTAGVRESLSAGAAAGDLDSLRHLLAHLLMEQDHDAVATEAERAVGTGDPETVSMGYWAWGDARKAAGDLENAALMYGKGVDTGFPGTSAGIRVDLARTMRDLGDAAGAAREVRLAMESGARDGARDAVERGGLLLGVWLHEDGDQLGAAEAFAAALVAARGSGSDLARTAMDNLTAVAYQAADRGEHAQAVQVLRLAGESTGAEGAGAEGPRVEGSGVASSGAEEIAAEIAGVARELAGECDDPAAVRAYFELAGRLTGEGPFTELNIADRLAALGEQAAARAIFERLSEHDDAEVRFVAGGRLLELLGDEGDDDAFFDVAQRRAADADSPIKGVFGSLLGMLQESRGDTEASLETLREAAAGGEPIALSTLAQTLVGVGQVEEGRQAYLRVLDAGDDDLAARAMVALGQICQDEDERQAREWYLKAVDAAEGHIGALAAMYLGALAKRDRDFPEALTWYQRVIDAGDSESGLAAAHLGELCYWLGDRDGALRYYELTLGLTEQAELVAEAACRLGEIRYERGDLDLARLLLVRAVETGDPGFGSEAEALLGKLARR